ncbi:MAG: hypothetical protein ACLR0P_07315 [Oscillospiraceae bacterium]
MRRYNRPTPQQVELVREELGSTSRFSSSTAPGFGTPCMGISETPITPGGRLWKNCRLHPAHPGYGCHGAPVCHFAEYSAGSVVRQQKRRLGGSEHLPVRHHLYVSARIIGSSFMLLLAFAVYIPIFSIMGADSLKDFILPALALAISMAAGNIRVFRSSLLDGYNGDFCPVCQGPGRIRVENRQSGEPVLLCRR